MQPSVPERRATTPNAGSSPSSPAIPPSLCNNTATPTPSHGHTDTTGSSTDPSKLAKLHQNPPSVSLPCSAFSVL
ncbi:Uncharacterized protein HZ326_8396 [Fusarium oxysporum f. sp. albedinis]|nr:Uncharacterized protein HZ326_8396 [Fusarium oxysporum f. sp. albedinis]